ncbi:MAG: pyridoxamine 5'-phosphate oxidase family protein [Candidatus Sifarchaeia archaeon]
MDNDQLCLHLLETAWPVYLTTIDSKGFPQTRAMFNLRNKERYPKLIPIFENHRSDYMILFSTNTSSTKMADIRKNKAASVYYCNPGNWHGVMFGGEIEIVQDSKLKKDIWHDGWERYYPGGYDDPDHTLLRIIPTVARGWTGSSTFRIELGDQK